MSDPKEYQRGYAAGRKKHAAENAELKMLKVQLDERRDNIYMGCLELALKHCGGWKIGKNQIKDAAGFCRIAKIFSDNSISELDED